MKIDVDYVDKKVDYLLKVKKNSPVYYALRDKNYRRLPNKKIIRVYINKSIYWEMANRHKCKTLL